MNLKNATKVQYVKSIITGEVATIKVKVSGFLYTVPIDTDNSDYQAIQKWVAAGNTIEEAD